MKTKNDFAIYDIWRRRFNEMLDGLIKSYIEKLYVTQVQGNQDTPQLSFVQFLSQKDNELLRNDIINESVKIINYELIKSKANIKVDVIIGLEPKDSKIGTLLFENLKIRQTKFIQLSPEEAMAPSQFEAKLKDFKMANALLISDFFCKDDAQLCQVVK